MSVRTARSLNPLSCPTCLSRTQPADRGFLFGCQGEKAVLSLASCGTDRMSLERMDLLWQIYGSTSPVWN